MFGSYAGPVGHASSFLRNPWRAGGCPARCPVGRCRDTRGWNIKERAMEASPVKRVLVVANRTASSSLLFKEIRRRAEAEPCEFTLLVPDVSDGKMPAWARDAV